MSSTSLDLSASTDLEWVTDLARPVLDAAKGAVARWPACCSQPLRRPVLSGAAMTFHCLQELNAPDNAGDSVCWCYEMSAYLYKCRHIEEHVLKGVRVRVFSPAKSVADCFKYRHKIGLDVAIEALRECRQSRRCSMDELWRYAGVCRVRNVMRPYLEALAA